MKNSFRYLIISFSSLLLLLGIALAACQRGSESTAAGTQFSSSTSLPMRTLNTIYNCRTAMINLADGSAENPEASYREIRAAEVRFSQFADRLEELERSFNDSDYMQFWDTLSSFGSIYQINTGTLNSGQLRQLVHSFRSFENDVVDLNRQFGRYYNLYRNLLNTLGEETDIEEVQEHIPLVNSITQKSVQLDALIKDFSESIFAISRKLRSIEARGHTG